MRKKFIKMKSEGKTGVNENGDTVVNYKGEKIIIAEFFRKQEIEKRLDKPQFKARIKRIARKMFPQIRKAEVQRKKG